MLPVLRPTLPSVDLLYPHITLRRLGDSIITCPTSSVGVRGFSGSPWTEDKDRQRRRVGGQGSQATWKHYIISLLTLSRLALSLSFCLDIVSLSLWSLFLCIMTHTRSLFVSVSRLYMCVIQTDACTFVCVFVRVLCLYDRFRVNKPQLSKFKSEDTTSWCVHMYI